MPSMDHLAQGEFQSLPGFILDTRSRSVTMGDRRQSLTRIEFRLLEELSKIQGGLLHREDLLRTVWGTQVSVEPRTVDSHIVRLRKKLHALGEKAPTIETVWGLGYRLRDFDEGCYTPTNPRAMR